MATTHQLLTNGVLTTSTVGLGAPPSSTLWMIKTIIFHNVGSGTGTGETVVEIFYDGNAAADKLLKIELQQDETFEWALGHMLVLRTCQLQGKAAHGSAVNFHIFGAEEDV